MYIFFKKGMRSRVCYISNRCSNANNEYLKSYDPKQESIIYLDANDCMIMQCLSFVQQVDSNG